MLPLTSGDLIQLGVEHKVELAVHEVAQRHVVVEVATEDNGPAGLCALATTRRAAHSLPRLVDASDVESTRISGGTRTCVLGKRRMTLEWFALAGT